FVISGDGIVRGCSSRDNDAHGIECSTAGAMIENNRVSNNDGDGIRLAGLCVATGNSVSNSGGAGIYMNGVANRVDSNMVFSNPVGIEQAVPGSMGNVVTRNVAANNTTNYMVTSASNFFAVTTDPGTAGPMDNVAQ
ncbi:MAG: right-handed parallel beta-helix repeat-containing protein, partial [Pseudomonadota bacterium]